MMAYVVTYTSKKVKKNIKEHVTKIFINHCLLSW